MMARQIETIPAPAKETASADQREAPMLKATALQWQSHGFLWREALVRLPANMILQDLQDQPGVWKNVQQSPALALRRFDRVTCVAFDESWCIRDVLVIDADNQRVVLGIRPGDKISLSSKTAQWEDERHRIYWAGDGFAVFRKPDDVRMLPQQFGTIEAARSEMYRQLYTKSA